MKRIKKICLTIVFLWICICESFSLPPKHETLVFKFNRSGVAAYEGFLNTIEEEVVNKLRIGDEQLKEDLNTRGWDFKFKNPQKSIIDFVKKYHSDKIVALFSEPKNGKLLITIKVFNDSLKEISDSITKSFSKTPEDFEKCERWSECLADKLLSIINNDNRIDLSLNPLDHGSITKEKWGDEIFNFINDPYKELIQDTTITRKYILWNNEFKTVRPDCKYIHGSVIAVTRRSEEVLKSIVFINAKEIREFYFGAEDIPKLQNTFYEKIKSKL